MAVNPPCGFEVVPDADHVEHDTTTDDGCICGPTQIPSKQDDGSVTWIVVHHSLDGREMSER